MVKEKVAEIAEEKIAKKAKGRKTAKKLRGTPKAVPKDFLRRC